MPAARPGAEYKPSAFVCAVRVAPVFSSTIVTSTLATAAPCWSLTVPVIFPAVLDWACTPTNKPMLSRSNSACNPNFFDIQNLLNVRASRTNVQYFKKRTASNYSKQNCIEHDG